MKIFIKECMQVFQKKPEKDLISRNLVLSVALRSLGIFVGMILGSASFIQGARVLVSAKDPLVAALFFVVGAFFLTLGRDLTMIGENAKRQECPQSFKKLFLMPIQRSTWAHHYYEENPYLKKTLLLQQKGGAVAISKSDLRFKLEIVLKLFSGESIETVSKKQRVRIKDLKGWRTLALSQIKKLGILN